MHNMMRRSLIGIVLLGIVTYTTVWYNVQAKEIEKLQVLNQVTNEELQMAQQLVKEQAAKLQEKDEEIAHLEAQPK